MLLHLSNQQPSISPKTLPNPSPPNFSLSFFPIPIPLHKTLSFLNYRIPRNLFLVRASASDTRTLPQSAIKRIADKLRSLGYVDDNVKSSPRHDSSNSISTSPGEIFVPLPDQLPKHRVGHTMDPSWSTPENPVPKPGSCTAIRRYNELRREAWKEKKEDREKRKAEGREGEKLPTLAELKLSPEELRRLSGLGIGLRKKLKIGKAGITEGIVNGIHERWRRTELVKIVCEDMSRLNMKRTHDLLERKTGGLVIWRSGSKIILYRGADYKYPYFNEGNPESHDTSDGASLDLRMDSGIHGDNKTHSSGMDGAASVRHDPSNNSAQPPLIQGVGYPNRVRFQLPGEAQLVEEADHLLDGLGPRFTDWYGYDPQPVDADLLPAKVRGYRRPFRLLPYGVKPVLTNDEMTTLRRLGRPMPCHFALGRNRKHQGLAAAILKLWEKCEIAKIAVKRGVQNTNSELMADELKHLTGGTVLSRDRQFIVLYRGKDFLPAAVSSAIAQRRKHGIHGEERRIVSSSSDGQESNHGRVESSSESGLGEMSVQKPRVGSRQRKLRSPEAAITRTTAKLSLALVKKERAEKLLEELEMEAIQKQPEVDKEGITEEERYMLRRVGLKMKPFLLLGRRGVFAGTVENMHLHWKYRELVKILSGERSIAEVYAVARTLEAESGGILVAVERVRKGHAIIVYRGKNYERPSSLRPDTLLNKREALKRSIEEQRRESLMLRVLKLSRNVDGLKLKLEKEKETIDFQPANDSKLFIKEQSVEESQSAECKGPEPDLEISSPHPASNQKIVQASNSHRTDSSSSSPNEGMDISSESLKTTWQDELSEFSMESDVMDVELDAAGDSVQISQQDTPRILSVKYVDGYGKEFHKTESKALFESVKGTDAVMEMDHRNGVVVPVDSTSMSLKCPDDNKASNSHRADSSSSSPNEGMDISSDSLKTWQDELSEFSMESDVMDVELDAIELHSDASRDSVQISQQDTPSILSVKYVDGYGKEFHKTESKALFESVKGTDAIMEMDNRNGEVVPVDSNSMSLKCLDDNKSQGQTSYSSTRSVNTKNQVSSADSRIQMDKENQSIWKSFRATRLSNKERLLLRKQALKMKKRPVIAIGRSNIVKGVAKTIKAHFEKHPLAIVNVKGRAKGTSVQEVVSKLEEATGAVLVSQEPSKVILYRGWSANEEPPYKAYRTNTRDAGNTSAGKEGMAKPIISPELIAAIRLECGLASKLEVESEMGPGIIG